MSSPIFIGIDPAAKCGVSWERDSKHEQKVLKLTAKPKANNNRKFLELVEFLAGLWEQSNVYVFLERRIEFSKFTGVKTEAPLSEIRGAVEALCTLYGFHLYRIGIMDLKKFFTNNHLAPKESMISAAQKNGYEGQDADEADAFLLMLYGKHLYQNGLLQAPKNVKKKHVPKLRRKSV